MEGGESLVIGPNVQFLVEVENRKDFVRAIPRLQSMMAITAQLMDPTVLKSKAVTKFLVQVSSFEIK